MQGPRNILEFFPQDGWPLALDQLVQDYENQFLSLQAQFLRYNLDSSAPSEQAEAKTLPEITPLLALLTFPVFLPHPCPVF